MPTNEFQRDKDYPLWNPKDTTNIPGIPNWKNDYGKNSIFFAQGRKPCYVNEKKFQKKNVLCGDYTIQVSIPDYELITQISDDKFISILRKEKSNLNSLKNISKENFDTFKKEVELVKKIRKENLTDIEKLFLDYAWHRCIIEDRLYARPYYGGKDTFLNVIK